jgi:hypothetical protein
MCLIEPLARRRPAGSGTISSQGYHVLTVEGRRRPAHVVAWEAAHGPLPEDWVVHHVDGDKLNNALPNLEAMPRSDHSRLHGGYVRGVEGGWMKRCTSCGELLPDTEFYAASSGSWTGKRRHCKACWNAHTADAQKLRRAEAKAAKAE